jgi:hypothetical protein
VRATGGLPNLFDVSQLLTNQTEHYSFLTDRCRVFPIYWQLINIVTRDYQLVYQVNAIRIVGKLDRTVIVPSDEAILTLTTCYPFTYFGNAPKRYIVTSNLISKSKKEPLNVLS